MDLLILGLLSTSILLFVLSFFQKDRYVAVEKEVEELSMTVLQENYQLKKRLRIVEEELMMDGGIQMKKSSSGKNMPIHAVVKNQVIALHQQGIGLDQIAKQSALSITDVKQILSKQ